MLSPFFITFFQQMNCFIVLFPWLKASLVCCVVSPDLYTYTMYFSNFRAGWRCSEEYLWYLQLTKKVIFKRCVTTSGYNSNSYENSYLQNGISVFRNLQVFWKRNVIVHGCWTWRHTFVNCGQLFRQKAYLYKKYALLSSIKTCRWRALEHHTFCRQT